MTGWISVASPEDVIISKLEWAKLSESERQLRDAAGILKLQANQLDVAYIDGWVSRLALQEQWSKAQALAV